MSSYKGFFESENQYVRRMAGEAAARTADTAARADESIRRNVSQVERRINELTKRVEALSQAFGSYVELGEVRDELARFAPAAAARTALRPFVQGLLPGHDRVPLTAEPADVPGYWITHAVRGLDALLRDDPSAEAQLAVAAERDPQRTALFVAYALRLAGVAHLAVPWLAAALGTTPPSGETALGVRRLWYELADGGYGSAGGAVLAEWLAQPGAVGSTAALRAAVELRRDPLAASRGSAARPPLGPRAPKSAAIEEALAAAASASATLTLLQRWYSEEQAEGADRTEAATVPAVADLLLALVDEGSPEEIPLLRRAARLRSEVRAEPPAVERYWDAPGGSVGALLIADLLGAGPKFAARRRTALAALRHTVAELAQELLFAASVEPPARMTFKLEGETLTVGSGHPPGEAVARLSSVIDRRAAEEAAHGKRKFAAEQFRRAAERKAGLGDLIDSAGDRLAYYRARSEEIGEAADSAYRTLMVRLGQVAEEAASPLPD